MKDYEENDLQEKVEITDSEDVEVKKTLPKLPIIIGAIVAAVAAIVIALVLILGGGSDKDDDDECRHRDRDDDGICDKCDEEVEIDDDEKACKHKDRNNDGICDKCDEKIETDKDDDDDDLHWGQGCSHEYSDWEIYSGDYCEERTYKRVCSICNDIEWKQGSDSDHDWELYQIVDPNCVYDGYSEKFCSICYKFEQYNIVPSNGTHDWETTEIIDYTCLSDGYSVRVCLICGVDEIFNIIPAAGEHEWESVHSYDNEYHWFECKNCDEVTDSIEHTYVGAACSLCGYNPYAGEYYITMWVSEQEGVEEQIQKQINDFMAANPGIIIHATIEGVTAADAGAQVWEDVASAPDIYCFNQDMLAPLVQAGALAVVSYDTAEIIRGRNDASSVLASSLGDAIYAYPMTSDNGYYLYYDKSIITDPTSLEAIIADCEKAYYNGKTNHLFRYNLENGWYTASFFFGAGCHSVWEIDSLGSFIGIDDNFNSPQGLVAMKGMQKLTHSIIYSPDADWFGNAAAIVTGIWNANAAEEHFGENLGVCKLPTFTVDGETYQLGSFSGNKLMGVKPQIDSDKAVVLELLASYLTDTECQMERYETFQWSPSNLEAQSSEEVQSNIHLAALAAQSEHAVPQGQIHGDWWIYAAFLGEGAKAAIDDQELQYILDYYDEYMENLFYKTVVCFENEDVFYNVDPDTVQTYIHLERYLFFSSFSIRDVYDYGYISNSTYTTLEAQCNSNGYIPVTDSNYDLVIQLMREYLSAFAIDPGEIDVYIDIYYDCFLFYKN